MNQCNVLAAEISDQGEALKVKNTEIKLLNEQIVKMKLALKERDATLSTVQNENSFQKQTITDLKNQLFQLQNEIEDAEFDKSEEIAIHKKKTNEAEQRIGELEKEKAVLTNKIDEVCMEREKDKQALEALRKEMEDGQVPAIEINLPRETADGELVEDQDEGTTTTPTHNTRPESTKSQKSEFSSSNAEAFSSNVREMRQNWKKLEEAEEKLQQRDDMLHETQSSLATLEHKHKASLKEIDDLRVQINGIQNENEKRIAEYKSMLRAKDDAIANLHDRLETYNEDLTKAEEEIDQLTAQIDQSDMVEMQNDLDQARTNLERERELSSSLTAKYEDLLETVKRLENETRELRDDGIAEMMTNKDEEIQSLQQELDVFRLSIAEEKKSSDKLMNMKASRIKELEAELKKVSKQTGISLSPLVLTRTSSHTSQTSNTSLEKDGNGNEQAEWEMELESLRAEIEELNLSKCQLEEDLEVKLVAKESEMAKIKSDLDNQMRKIVIMEDAYKGEIAKLTAEISTLNHKSMVEGTTLIQKEKVIEGLRQDFAELSEKYKTESEMRQDEESSQQNGWKKEKRDLQEEIVTLRKGLAESEADNSELQEDLMSLKSQLAERTDERRVLHSRVIGLEKEASLFAKEKLELQDTISKLEEDLSQLSGLKDKLSEAQREMDALQHSHSIEVKDLRDAIQRAKDLQASASPQDQRPSTAKRAYHLALEKKQKKELEDMENKTKKEIASLKEKLADRDTTIAATIKASVAQEKKLTALRQRVGELEMNGSVSSGMNGQTEKIHELEETIVHLNESKSHMTSQIAVLRKRLSDANVERKTGDVPSAHSSLQEINEYRIKLQERDGAIATLVKSSITQEQQITSLREEVAEFKARNQNRPEPSHANRDGPSWEEFRRLQQESEMFAGQIIELDEEIEELRNRLMDEQAKSNIGSNLTHAVAKLTHQVQNQESQIEEQKNQIKKQQNLRMDEENQHSKIAGELTDQLAQQKKLVDLKSDEVNRLKRKLKDSKRELEEEQDARHDYEDQVKNLKSKLKKSTKLARVQDELDEVEESNLKLQHEVRELRRKMRMSVLEAEKVPDLEAELNAMKDTLNSVKLESAQNQADVAMEKQVHIDLKIARDERDNVERQLQQFKEDNTSLEKFIKELQHTDAQLRVEISNLKSSLDTLQTQMNEEVSSEQEKYEKLLEEKSAFEVRSRNLVDQLRSKIKDLENDIDEQNQIIAALTNEVKKLRTRNPDSSDANDIILALTDEVKKLRSKQLSKEGEDDDVIKALSDEVRTLHAALNKKHHESSYEARNIESTVRAEVEDEIQSMRHQKEFLAKEVARLQTALDNIKIQNPHLQEMQKKVDEAEKGRTQFEKTMISTYERKLNLMQMNKDLTIDGLRKELTQSKERHKEAESDLLSKIRTLETQKHELEAELKAKMQHKNAKIQFLEQTLSAHEQVSGQMKEELDQLQRGMETSSVTRRAETEELQEELMDVQNKASKYEREISSLKMKLEEQKLQHRNEIARMEDVITSLESDNSTPMMRDVAIEREKALANDYRQQVDGLRSRVNYLQDENVNLRHKIEKEAESRSSKNDKWRNSALQEQVFKLQQRLRVYEGDSDSIVSSSSRRSARTLTETSPRIPRTPSSSFRRSGGRDDISTHTEMTF